jgi:hypothetical protein
MAKIQAATNACHELVRTQKTYDTDLAITELQRATTDMVSKSKMSIFEMAEDLNEEQQTLIYGKVGLALSLHVKQFIESTNKCLSWDMTDPSDARNQYKSCPHCGAVFIKTEGCDGNTTCGAVPRDFKRTKPRFLVQFRDVAQTGWVVQFFINGNEVLIQSVPQQLATYSRQVVECGGKVVHQKREGAVVESGCGASVAWTQMRPIDPSKLMELALIELQKPGQAENKAKTLFESSLKRHSEKNKEILSKGLS